MKDCMYKPIIFLVLFFQGIVASHGNEKFLLPMYHQAESEENVSSCNCCKHCIAGILIPLHTMRFSPPDNIVATSYQQSEEFIKNFSLVFSFLESKSDPKKKF